MSLSIQLSDFKSYFWGGILTAKQSDKTQKSIYILLFYRIGITISKSLDGTPWTIDGQKRRFKRDGGLNFRLNFKKYAAGVLFRKP